jgi:hypothetical protein
MTIYFSYPASHALTVVSGLPDELLCEPVPKSTKDFDIECVIEIFTSGMYTQLQAHLGTARMPLDMVTA